MSLIFDIKEPIDSFRMAMADKASEIDIEETIDSVVSQAISETIEAVDGMTQDELLEEWSFDHNSKIGNGGLTDPYDRLSFDIYLDFRLGVLKYLIENPSIGMIDEYSWIGDRYIEVSTTG